jgi:enoyl-CoA hydratase/carnithine racemase
MTDEAVSIRVEGPVLIVTIDRPGRRNAIDHATAHRLEAAWDRLDGDPELRAAVLTGSGGFFCAGADLKAAAAGAPPARTDRRGQFGTVQAPPEKPLVAAIEGDALGGGCELALACDLIAASRTSRFGLPESCRGVLAAAGGLIRLPRRLPLHIAMEMVLTGAPQPAERLYDLGLINRLCAPGEALAGAIELARTIAENAPLAVTGAKRMMMAALGVTEAEAWALQQPELDRVRDSADYREGIAAFAEKRAPKWQGR